MGNQPTNESERYRRFLVSIVVASLLLFGSPTTAEAQSQAQGTGSISTLDDPGWSDPAVVFNASGNPVIAYFAGFSDLKVLTCGTPNCASGNTIVTVANHDAAGGDVFMRLNAAGHPVISYETLDQVTASAFDIDFHIVTCGDSTCSSGNVFGSEFDDLSIENQYGSTPSFDFDAVGNPVIAFSEDLDPVAFFPRPVLVHCGNPTCTSDNVNITPSVLTREMQVGNLEVDATGALLLPLSGGEQGLQLLHCSDVSCATTVTLSTIDFASTNPRVSTYAPSMELDASGNPVISYLLHPERSNGGLDDGGGLEVVRCADPRCSTVASVTSADPNPPNSSFVQSSIGLVGGYPVVAYSSSGDIKVTFCGNAACSFGNRFLSLGSGVNPMLAVDGGTVVVAYLSGDDLKLWYCDSAPCGGVGTCEGELATIDLSLPGAPAPTSGRDVIVGTPGADVIDALGGDDLVCGFGGDDIIAGGDGADKILAGSGDDEVTGGAGDDRLIGAQGNDTMAGGDGQDTLHGNRGDDDLDGGAGDDRIFGYADNDTIRGGEGNDRLHGNFGEDVIFGGAGDDLINGYGDEDTLHGGDGNDTMRGNAGNDMMFGEAGDDRMWGYAGDDTLAGGPGQDLIGGNFGDDALRGGEDDDTLFGSAGADDLSGGPGDDSVAGNSGDDLLSGGLGDDTLDGGINVDVCNGDAGTDSATRCETTNDIP